MSTVIYQSTAGRLWIDNQEFSLEDLVMEYKTSLQDTTLVSIYSKTHPTGVDDVLLSEIEDNVGGTYANAAAWVVWWKALETVGEVSATIVGGATEAKQDTLIAKDFATQTTLAAVLAKLTSDPATQTTLAAILAKIIAAPATEAKQDTLLGKQFPNVGIHVQTGTGAATSGTYTGFLVLEEATISAITLTDSNKVTGTNDFSGITLSVGTFIEIPGGFSTLTLSAGSMILVKGS